ncbi:MAG: PQQ-binding-like beta-propeller repeat protein [Rubripirellula sp.]
MNTDQAEESKEAAAEEKESVEIQKQKYWPLRIWPVLVALLGMAATRYIPRLIEDESMMLVIVAVLGPVLFSLGILIWWLGFSRATIGERFIGLLGILVAAGITAAVSDKTMMGPALVLIMVPMGIAAFAIGVILCRKILSFKRTWISLLLATLGFGFTALLQSSGMWGNGRIDWQWRWEPTPEQMMLATRKTRSNAAVEDDRLKDIDLWIANPEWPRFRGRDGLSQQHGPEISVDWTKNPPEELWRIPVGPGWASFVVAGDLLFTQEQHGDEEAVVCYMADSGVVVWTHLIASRFFDPLGGPGPRATPTLANGRLFAQGANGQLQRLDPRTGELVWEQDIREVADRKPPTWGFSSSPLVVGEVVMVHAGGKDDKGVLAFDANSGDLKWSAAAGNDSYSSPQSATLAGENVVLMLTNDGINVLDPETGDSWLNYDWPYQGYRVIQPPVINGDSILLATQELGTRLIQVSKTEDGKFAAEEVWTSAKLKPDFNDFVLYEDHLYGFDGTIFTCIDREAGERKWKRGRYGKGQVLLLSSSGTLLVQSENGEVVLLKASPERHQELAKLDALEGRTWNHPVVVGDRLYVRNSAEAVCYRLPTIEPSVQSEPLK